MDRRFRPAFNAGYTPEFYRDYMARLETAVGGKIPFKVAETPAFVPPALRARLVAAAEGIVAQISQPELIERLTRAVPPHLDVPRRDALASCIQVDLAVVRDAAGEFDVKLVELQGFPSLYAFMVVQATALADQLQAVPGLARAWTPYFNGLDRESYLPLLRRALVADCDPREVILMDLAPTAQKTYPDFAATKRFTGVDAVCPTELEREGRTLYRRLDGRRVAVRRIFNRVVFDELIKKGSALPFSYRDDLDVTWVPHPNWYWMWSKYTLPFLDHPAVPRARFLSDVATPPDDLSNYVLKPLFSFAGTGVKVDVTREDLDRVPDAERGEWILQEKITYAEGFTSPDGHGIKAEVRMMFLRGPGEATPRLVMNLGRLSRGKMLGVDHNKDLDWVGGTVALWPADE